MSKQRTLIAQVDVPDPDGLVGLQSWRCSDCNETNAPYKVRCWHCGGRSRPSCCCEVYRAIHPAWFCAEHGLQAAAFIGAIQ